MPLPRYEIELVGGPYDGHRQHFVVRPQWLHVPLDQNMERFLAGDLTSLDAASATHECVYQLRRTARGWQYQFVETRRRGA